MTVADRGRPPFEWTEEIEEEILNRIAGGETIRNICAKDRDDWLPSWETVRRRLASDKNFAAQYANARESQADLEFDAIRQIADEATPENAQVARLQIDVRKWRAGKMRPKVYGDRQTVDHENTDGSLASLFASIASAGKTITNGGDEGGA